MRTAPTLGLMALTGLALVGPARAQTTQEDNMVTTTIRNGHSVSSVSQSGDPAKATRHVEKRPGYTRIEQHSGGNHSVVVQSTNPADMPKMPDLKMPDLKMPDLKMPDLKMPDLKMPDLGKLQTDIDRLLRRHGLADDE